MPPSCPLFSIGLWKGQFPEGKTHFKIIDWNWILITYQIVRYHTVPRRSHKGCIKLCHLFCSESTKVSRFTPDFQPLGGREVVQVCRAVTTGAAPKAVNARQEPAPEQNLSGTRTSRWPHHWLELVPKDDVAGGFGVSPSQTMCNMYRIWYIWSTNSQLFLFLWCFLKWDIRVMVTFVLSSLLH